jgi:hypothetical protein
MSSSSQSSKSAFAPEALLYSREASRQLLGGISIASIKRLERNGELTPVRLNKRSPTAQVFYRRAQVLALAQVEPINA